MKEGITLPLWYISRDIKCRRKHLDELKIYVDQIDTRMYHEFTIDEICLCGDCIFTRGNETTMACYDLFERQYVHLRFFSFSCLKVQTTDIIRIY